MVTGMGFSGHRPRDDILCSMQPELMPALITVVVADFSFLGGGALEKHRITQQNRLKPLESVEQWFEEASQLS